MRKFTITTDDGQELTGQLPEGWHEVPLTPYVALLLTAQPVPAGIGAGPHAYAHPAGCQALAELLSLPDAEPLLAARLRLLLPLYEAAPWLFDQALPTSTLVSSFTHRGISYTHGGQLAEVAASQWEALATILQASQDNPLAVAPQLLAVLYQPTDQAQTPASVRDASLAFATLPVSVAWPAILDFFMRLLPLAMPIQRYLAARPQVEQAVSALEKLLTPSPTSGPRGFYWSTGRWLARTWLKLVRKRLATFLRPLATSAAAPAWPRNLKPAAN